MRRRGRKEVFGGINVVVYPRRRAERIDRELLSTRGCRREGGLRFAISELEDRQLSGVSIKGGPTEAEELSGIGPRRRQRKTGKQRRGAPSSGFDLCPTVGPHPTCLPKNDVNAGCHISE
ncbi:hypothetical protein AAG570_000456 [Ranatra chinensis]|uniref:Uncharacterized protein n=1 Tax=Ranatra chinensis TaxID=642074 RepID=A0ABD0YXU5_9HEMI